MRGEEGGICFCCRAETSAEKEPSGKRLWMHLFGLLQHGVEKSTLDVFFSCFAYCTASVW